MRRLVSTGASGSIFGAFAFLAASTERGASASVTLGPLMLPAALEPDPALQAPSTSAATAQIEPPTHRRFRDHRVMAHLPLAIGDPPRARALQAPDHQRGQTGCQRKPWPNNSSGVASGGRSAGAG